MKKLIVITGPSGVGKSHLAHLLDQLHPGHFGLVKLFSTRQPRSNEQFVDRIFITPQEFAAKQENSEFVFDGSFAGNQYGYAAAALNPGAKHLIVNAWPAFIPKFSVLPNVILLGLTIEPESLPMLKRRMVGRGDSLAEVTDRLPFIQRDIRDLNHLKAVIQQQGDVFTIKDDQTIPESVIPWLQAKLVA